MRLEKFVADRLDRAGFERVAAGVMFLQGERLTLDLGDAGVADRTAGEKQRRGLPAKIAIDAGVLDEVFAGSFCKIVCRC